MRKLFYLTLAVSMAAILSTPVLAGAPKTGATIVRTTHGIPHITAKDWRGIGYGVGYSYAQDNLCMLAEEFVTLRGERSLHFGPEGKNVPGFEPIDNLSSDVFFRANIDLPTLRRGINRASPEMVQLLDGYILGYNRHLREIGANAPEACRGKAWLRPIDRDDMLRLLEKQAMLAGSLALLSPVANAAPPATNAPQKTSQNITLPEKHETGFGSNAWGFGSEVTANGRGVLVGNPHFPWNGTSRFYQMHITIPGVIDVMGAGLGGSPLPQIGFNKDVAWTHTVTAARHFTVFELKLAPNDPTSYLIDGKSEKMSMQTISVPMPNGASPITRNLYSSKYGPILSLPSAGLAWNNQNAFAIKDANRFNQRTIGTWVKIAKSRNVGDIQQTVESTLGIPWVNTISADRHGNVFLADVTAVPNVNSQKIADCATPRSAPLAASFVLLDGSRNECEWDIAPNTPVAGLMPAKDQAKFLRKDYVANSNDSYWLTNAKIPATPLSPILGAARTERTLRTRSGLLELDRRFNGTDGLEGNKVTQEIAREMAFANKSLAVELSLDKLLSLCQGQADLANACDILSKWNRRFDVDSKGAYLFVATWDGIRRIKDKWVVPFDVNDPINTPRDLKTDGENGAKLLAALRNAVAQLAKENIALDATWGSVQFAIRGSEKIPVHGADGNLGVLNVQMSDKTAGGLVPRHGTSYIQVVSFDENGPIADAILSYSQSTDPKSPYFADQTHNYSKKKWQRLPFTPEQIEAAKIGEAITIKE